MPTDKKIKTGKLNPKEEKLCSGPVGCSDFVSKQLLLNLGYNQANKKEFDEALQQFKKSTGVHDDAWRVFGHVKQNKGDIIYQDIEGTKKIDDIKNKKFQVGDLIALRNNTGQSSYQDIANKNNLYDKKAKNVNTHIGYISNIDDKGNVYVDHYLGDNIYRRDILKNNNGKYKLWKTDYKNQSTGEEGYFGEYDVAGIARPNIDKFKNEKAKDIELKNQIKQQYESYIIPDNIKNFKTPNSKVQAAFDDFKKNYKNYGEISGLSPQQLEKMFYITLGQAEQETKSGKLDSSENIYATNIGIPIVKAVKTGLVDSSKSLISSFLNTVTDNKPLLPAWKRQILIDKDIEQGLIPKDKINDKKYIETYINDRPEKFGKFDESTEEYTPSSKGWIRAKYISEEAKNLGISEDAIINDPSKAFVNSLFINADNYYSLKNMYGKKYNDDELIYLSTNSYNSSLSKNKEYVDHFLPRGKIDYSNKVYEHSNKLYNSNLKIPKKFSSGGKLLESLSNIGLQTLADQTSAGKIVNGASTLNDFNKDIRDTTKNTTATLLNPILEGMKLPAPILGDLMINTLQEGLRNIPKDKKTYNYSNDKFKMNNKYNNGGNLDFYTNQIAQEDAIKQAIIGTITSQIGNAKQGLTKAATMGLFSHGGKLTEYKGNTHENGGIPIGNAEVEHGETNHNGYIFSDRLMLGKKSFAQLSKDIDKRYSKRPDDKISKDAKERELNNLMQIQESTGMTNKSNTYANGGYFMNLINKMNKYNANDIRGNKPRVNTLDKNIARQDAIDKGFGFTPPNVDDNEIRNDVLPTEPSTLEPNLAMTEGRGNSVFNKDNNIKVTDMLSSNKSYQMDQISPWWLAASNVGNIANLAMSRPSKVSLDRVKPSLIDTYRSNTILRNELRNQANQSNQDVRGTANTAGTFLAASVNNTARNNNIIGSKIAESNLNALNTNVGIKNVNSAQNAQIQASEQDLQQRENDASKTIRSNAISSIGNNVMQYGLDRANVNMTNKMMNYITPQGYELIEAEDGTIKAVRKKGSGSTGITFKSIS